MCLLSLPHRDVSIGADVSSVVHFSNLLKVSQIILKTGSTNSSCSSIANSKLTCSATVSNTSFNSIVNKKSLLVGVGAHDLALIIVRLAAVLYPF